MDGVFMNIYRFTINAALLVFTTATIAQDGEWMPVTGTETLTQFVSGLKAERALPNGEMSRAEYRADGTGTLYSWGETFPRAWKIEGDDQLCITEQRVQVCYKIDRNAADSNLYRLHDVVTGKMTEFRVTDDRGIATGEPKDIGSEGGAAVASADELAAELSNPNTAVASLNFKNQFRWYEGDLPDADGQSNYTLLFQPVLPFVLDSGDKIIFRPAIPLLVDQPGFSADDGGFEGNTGLGDIIFDLAYAPKSDSSLITAFGLISSLPTATNDLGSDRWTLGPEMLIAKSYSKGLYGVFPNHQWDVAGSGDRNISLTTIQPLFVYLPGGGWNLGTGPAITYDWEAEQWTVPLQFNFGKTVVWDGRPWKLSAEVNYYVEKPDAFGPEWMVSFNITPVVKNRLASWFGLGD
jgi:hypothetical protein